MSFEDDAILEDKLFLQGTNVEVLLTKNFIAWSPMLHVNGDKNMSGHGETCGSIFLEHVISIFEEEPGELEKEPLNFSIQCVYRASKLRWKVKTLQFSCATPESCQQWVKSVKTMLKDFFPQRPSSLLVFINPIGGLRKGPQLYTDRVAPHFERADISTEVIVTERAGHAREYLLDMDLSRFDGVVCVGGDGMLSEVVHGLLLRSRRNLGHHGDGHMPGSPEVTPKHRIGVIAAGSTDTVAYSTMGTNDPTTAAIQIILGTEVGMDVNIVHSGDHFLRYNLSLLGYGFYGDIILESQEYRWMGPKRYDWLGIKRFLANKAYYGEVSYLPVTDSRHHPRDGSRCTEGCDVCHGTFHQIGTKEKSHGDDESDGSLAASGSSEEDSWKTVRGAWIAVNSFLVSCRCEKCPTGLSPSNHLGNGSTDLVLVSACSRVDFLRHLIRCANPSQDQFNMPFVQVHRVRAFRFKANLGSSTEVNLSASTSDSGSSGSNFGHDTPRQGRRRRRLSNGPTSVWNCDGEALPYPEISVKVHPQLIRLFGSGPPDPDITEMPSQGTGNLGVKRGPE